MNRGLTQGLLGRAKHALAPSSVAVGPNTYLGEKDFLKMLGVAFVVHLLAFGVYALMPNQKVTDIPVRALSFKLGGEDRVGAYAPAAGAENVASVPDVAPPVMQAVSRDSWHAAPNTPAPGVPAPLKPLARIEPMQRPLVKQPKIVKVEDPKPSPELAPLPAYAPAPAAVAPQPLQYVREVGAPSPQVVAAAMQAATPEGTNNGLGVSSSMSEQTARETRARYTLEVSSWVQHHMQYPEAAGGRAGRVVVLVKFDRFGNVRYNAIDQSSGLKVFDDAALDMIRRANPMPAPPPNYPDIDQIAFTIPLNFTAPL